LCMALDSARQKFARLINYFPALLQIPDGKLTIS